MSGYILLGSPGAGKGTIGHSIGRTWGMEHVCSGDLLRQEVKDNTETGKKIFTILQEGGQVPDPLITQLVLNRLNPLIESKTEFVLDGFPQTIGQWESLKETLDAHPEFPVTTICVEVLPETALQRMTGRLTCETCNEIYHKETTPSLQCTICGNNLVVRKSDVPELAATRLETFESTTKKVMEHIRGQPKTFFVDGNSSKDQVLSQITHLI
jgi:adenylate kinase